MDPRIAVLAVASSLLSFLPAVQATQGSAPGTITLASEPRRSLGLSPATPSFSGQVDCVVPFTDGSFVAAGNFNVVTRAGGTAGTERQNLARIRANGEIDPSFPEFGQRTTVHDLVRDPQGRVVVAFSGDSIKASGVRTRNSLARILPDGTLDPDWTGPLSMPNTNIICLAADDQGRIYVGGSITNFGGVSGANQIVRLDAATGAVDPAFKPNPGLPVNLIRPLPDGTVLVSTLFGLKRYNTADGSPASGFNYANNFSSVQAIVPIPGTGDFFLGFALNGILRMNNAGATSPGPAADFEVSELIALPSGKFLAAGSFMAFNGSSAGRIAHFSADGTAASGLDFGSGFSDYVKCLAYEPTSKRVLVGGNFLSFNGTPASRFAMFDDTTAPVGPGTPEDPLDAYLTDAGVPAALRGPTTDADGDGLPNLVEYALGLDPYGSGSAFTGSLPVLERGTTELRLTYRRLRTDVTYRVETSDHPGESIGWSATGVSQGTPTGDGTVTATLPITGGAAFLRLSVSR